MGRQTNPPKPGEPDQPGLLDELEDYIKDYIHQGVHDDPALDELIVLVLDSKTRGVDIFSSTLGLLDRPALFEKYIRRWIIEGYEEVERLRVIQHKKG